MKVSIRNIGKVASADIELNGLTAIIGDNDMGKSTVGKVLYAVFHSMDNIEKRIHEAQVRYVTGALKLPYNARWLSVLPSSYFEGLDFVNEEDLHDVFMRRRPDLPYVYPSTLRLASESGRQRETWDIIKRIQEQIARVRMIPYKQLLHAVASEKFNTCFDGQFLPNYADVQEKSSVSISDSDSNFHISWSDDGMSSCDGYIEHDAWFIGTPLVLDALSNVTRRGGVVLDQIHNELVGRLRRGKMDTLVSRELVRQELRPVFDLLQSNLTAPFSRDNEGRLVLSFPEQKNPLRVANLSMGMKVFSVLRLMLEANLMRQDDVVIFDEPENHLHPGFQELFARIVIKIQRIFNLRMLITTHSPYFLQALELYSRQENHDTGLHCDLKVYQPESTGSHGMVNFADISGDTSEMYRKFAIAMREMDILRREVDGYQS